MVYMVYGNSDADTARTPPTHAGADRGGSQIKRLILTNAKSQRTCEARS